MNITLYRTAQSDKGTFGVLTVDNAPLCVTCEDPWNNNQRGISCIPAGTYNCIAHNGAKFRNVWQLLKVPGRDAILIHAGNTIKDTHGCILVGKGFNEHLGLPCITESVLALDSLHKKLPSKFAITIIDSFKQKEIFNDT